jgi:hypothetical protein
MSASAPIEDLDNVENEDTGGEDSNEKKRHDRICRSACIEGL